MGIPASGQRSSRSSCRWRHRSLGAFGAAGLRTTISFDEPAHQDGDGSLAESIGGEDRELALADCWIVLEGWLAELPDREREILRLRFEEDLTQREIAGMFGISQMHVSRLLRRSIKDLRQRAVEHEGPSARVA